MVSYQSKRWLLRRRRACNSLLEFYIVVYDYRFSVWFFTQSFCWINFVLSLSLSPWSSSKPCSMCLLLIFSFLSIFLSFDYFTIPTYSVCPNFSADLDSIVVWWLVARLLIIYAIMMGRFPQTLFPFCIDCRMTTGVCILLRLYIVSYLIFITIEWKFFKEKSISMWSSSIVDVVNRIPVKNKKKPC